MLSSKWSRRTNRKQRSTSPHTAPRLSAETLEDRSVPAATGFRPIDEAGNNATNLGTAGTDLLRISDPVYANGFSTPSMGGGAPTFVAGPRLVSNIVSNQNPTLFGDQSTDTNTVDQHGLSDFGYTWGQFLDHDMDLTPDQGGQTAPNPNPNKDGNNGFPIPKDANHDTVEEGLDPIGSLAFSRSIFDPTTGTAAGNAREQINVNTSFLDLSQVYGSTAFASDALRLHSGGLLKTSPGNMLPFNSLAYFSQEQLDALNMANDAHLVADTDLYAAGDRRANETIELTALHTLFLRNHNAIATALASQDPAAYGVASWTDETLFQEARKINIAQYQNITYNGYLPALLGPTALAAYTGYDPAVDPSIATEFSTVGFRFGHTLLNNTVARDADDGSSVGDLILAAQFFDPKLVSPFGGTDPFGNAATDIDAILKGDADNNAQALDVMAVSSIRNLLFGQGGPGEDLIARDIWRAHDHGIGTFNDLLRAYHLPLIVDDGSPLHGLDQITSDPHVQSLLAQAYFSANFLNAGHGAGDIDPFIAGLAEDHAPGSDMGSLFTAILADQFTRLRDGDQFFYLNQDFTAAEQTLIAQGGTLARVIRSNTGITNLQDDVFHFFSQEDGKGKGYYTNKNGQAELTGSQTGTTLTDAVYNALVAALDPNHTGFLALVDANGNHLADTFLQSYADVKSYLSNSSDGMGFKLSVQLLTAEINVALGKVDSTTSVSVPAVTRPGTSDHLSADQQASLQAHGVSDPAGVAKVQSVTDAAIALLFNWNGDTTYGEALKNVLDGINSNEAIFILN